MIKCHSARTKAADCSFLIEQLQCALVFRQTRLTVKIVSGLQNYLFYFAIYFRVDVCHHVRINSKTRNSSY